MNKSYLSCPCCRLPTLSERGVYEICRVCWWEDDGQDDQDADSVWGGPNRHYSLSKARLNFFYHGDMYDIGDQINVVAHPSSERKALIQYALSVQKNNVKLDIEKFNSLLDAESKTSDK